MELNKQIEEESQLSIERKLSELMLRGWTMLADACPVEHCRCPLMRNAEQHQYCCNCETWVINNEDLVRKKFRELISNSSNPSQVKQKEIISIPKRHIETEIKAEIQSQDEHEHQLNNSNTILQIHEKKLIYLSERLNSETDLRTTNVVLKAINLCIKNIKELSTLK